MKSMRRRRCPSRRVRKVVAALNADRIHVSGSSLPSSENNRIVTNNVARLHCFRAAPREMKAPRVHLTAAFAFFLCPYAWAFLMYSFASGVLQSHRDYSFVIVSSKFKIALATIVHAANSA